MFNQPPALSGSEALPPHALGLLLLHPAACIPLGLQVGILSTEERLARLLKAMRETTPDVRTYLREAALLRKGACIPDSQGVDEAMMAALDAQEKAQGGKALLFADAKGMEAFRKSVAALQAKVGADKADQAQLDAAALEEDYTQMVEQLVGARNAAVVDAKQRDAVFLANATAAH